MADPIMLEKAVYWVNIAYIASVGLTIIMSVMVVFLSRQKSTLFDAQLKQAGMDAQRDAATANLRAAEANLEAEKAHSERAALAIKEEQLQKQNLELSAELERQTRARLEAEERMQRQARQPQQPQPILQPQPPPQPQPPLQQPQQPQTAPQTDQLAPVPPVPPVYPTAPRVLTPMQEQLLVSAMNHFAGGFASVVELADAEAGPLARQIAGLLQNAKLNVVVNRFGALLPPQYGVVCTHGPNDSAASEFVKTMRSFNLTVYERSGSAGQFEILVGLNPPA